MKTLLNGFWVIFSFVMFLSCEKDNSDDNNLLIGKWTNTTDYTEYIDFINDSSVKVNGHDFRYEIIADSIYFQYSGRLFVMCHKTSHKFQVDYHEQEITIENIGKLCLVWGSQGQTIYSKKIQPNIFIGKWITTDFTDTLYFTSNNRLERPRKSFNDIYEYSFTNDYLTIQYSGPDEIYVLPVTFGYEFTNDTLCLDFATTYYPDIETGLKKYLKHQ